MAYAPSNLKGKVALVTGGNRGIGFGMADGMAQARADISISGSKPRANLEAEGKLNQLGIRVPAQRVDVASGASVVAGMAGAVAAMGRVDTVIANAGVGGGAPCSRRRATTSGSGCFR